LGGEFEGEGVETLRQIANVLQEMVVGNKGGDRGKEAGGSGDEGLGDAGSNRAETSSSGGSQAREGVDDAPNGAEQADEWSNTGGGGEPGHSFFHAAHFFGSGELHGDGHGLKALHFLRRRIASACDLRLEFAITSGVDIGKGRARGDKALRIGNALGGTEKFEEMVALTADASKDAELLENKGPGDQGKKQKQHEDGTSYPAGLRENI